MICDVECRFFETAAYDMRIYWMQCTDQNFALLQSITSHVFFIQFSLHNSANDSQGLMVSSGTWQQISQLVHACTIDIYYMTTIVIPKIFQGRGFRVTILGSYNNILIPYVFSFFSSPPEQQLPRFRRSSCSNEVLREIKTKKKRQKFCAQCVPCMYTVCTAA